MELVEHINFFYSAFPGNQPTIDDVFGEDDRVAVHGTFPGNHKGDLIRIALSDKKVVVSLMIIYRIQNGKIVQQWMNADQFALMQQHGGIPAAKQIN
jgi:predicted ester cyclase